MSISLKKGQKISLSKDNTNLKHIMVGLGWDPVQNAKKGFLGSLFGGGGSDIDCDASVIMLDENDKLQATSNIICYSNLKSRNGSVVHMGDNLTGAGDGDDEQIKVDLSKIASNVKKLVFVVNIYACASRKQHFGMIQNAFIRIIDNSNSKELCKFNLSDDFSGKTSIFAGEIYNNNGEWKFSAIGEGNTARDIKELARQFK